MEGGRQLVGLEGLPESGEECRPCSSWLPKDLHA